MKGLPVMRIIFALALATVALPTQAQANCSNNELHIPATVQNLYVLFQREGRERENESSELIDIVDIDGFCAGFEGWRREARTGGWLMIVTAQNSRGQWVQGEIQFRGRRLRHHLYRDPSQSISYPGAVVPLD